MSTDHTRQTRRQNAEISLSLSLSLYNFAFFSVLLSFRCSHFTSYISFMNFSLLYPPAPSYPFSNGKSPVLLYLPLSSPRTPSSSSSSLFCDLIFVVYVLVVHRGRRRRHHHFAHHPSLDRVRPPRALRCPAPPQHPPVEIANNPPSGSLSLVRRVTRALSLSVSPVYVRRSVARKSSPCKVKSRHVSKDRSYSCSAVHQT